MSGLRTFEVYADLETLEFLMKFWLKLWSLELICYSELKLVEVND